MNQLAQDLWEARRLGHTIGAARDDLPQTKEDAYAVQDAVVALSGLPRCGYKVGSTSKEAQKLLNTDEPGAGALLAPFVHESPARIEIVPDQMPAVEGEFLFRFGKDLPARAEPYEMAELAEAIDGVAGCVEVVGTRFSGGLEGKGRLLTTADCGVNIALVTGAWSRLDIYDMRDHGVTMTIDDAVKGSGTGSRALDDPRNVIHWFVNHQSRRHIDIKAGDILATGTCTGLDPVHPGDTARADFGTLGAVEIVFAHSG